MFAAVRSAPPDHSEVVVHEGECGFHLFVGQGPVAVTVVEVVESVLEEDSDWLSFGLPNPRRVNVAASNIDETADMTDDFPEGIGALPGNREGADSARAIAADCSVLWLVAESIGLCHLGEDFLEQETRVLPAEGIVFHTAVVLSPRDAFTATPSMPWIDEDSNGHWHQSLVNQVVENNGNSPIPLITNEVLSILEYHDWTGPVLVILRRHVNPVIPDGAGIDLAGIPGELGD